MLYADHIFIVCVCWMSHTGPFMTRPPQSVRGCRHGPADLGWGALSALGLASLFSHGEKRGSRERSRLALVCPSVNPRSLRLQGGEQKTLTGDGLCARPLCLSEALPVGPGAACVAGPPRPPWVKCHVTETSAVPKGWGECARFGCFYC